MANARAAGDGEFDAVVSSYAIDHLSQEGSREAISEVHRVLKPGGEFLLLIVNSTDWVIRILSPPIAHHRRQDPLRWRQMIEDAGFRLEEDGRSIGTFYFLARRENPIATGGSGRVP